MATNFVQDGMVLQWTNGTGSAVGSGDLVQVGQMGIGVALVDIASAATGSVMTDGVFDCALDASDTTAIGAPAWTDLTTVYNDSAAGRYFVGYFTEVKGAASSQMVGVRLARFVSEPARFITLAATGNQALTAADFMSGRVDVQAPNTAALTLALPSVSTIPVGSLLRIKKTDATAQAVTIDPAGSETIAGGASHNTIDANNDWALFQSTGAAWVLVDSAIA